MKPPPPPPAAPTWDLRFRLKFTETCEQWWHLDKGLAGFILGCAVTGPFIVLFTSGWLYGDTPAHRALIEGDWLSAAGRLALATTLGLPFSLASYLTIRHLLRRSNRLRIDQHGVTRIRRRKERRTPWAAFLRADLSPRLILLRTERGPTCFPKRAIGGGPEVAEFLSFIEKVGRAAKPTAAPASTRRPR